MDIEKQKELLRVVPEVYADELPDVFGMHGDYTYKIFHASEVETGGEGGEKSVRYKYSMVLAPRGTPEAVLDKEIKRYLLSVITVKTSEGNLFDGNETARNNLMSAIKVSEITGKTKHNWKMADNSIKEIDVKEAQEALYLSIFEVGRIIGAVDVLEIKKKE